MAKTVQEHLDAFLADPDHATLWRQDGIDRVELTEQERLDTLQQWAENAHAADLVADKETGERTEFAQAKAVYTKLKNGNATQVETQKFLALIGKHVFRMRGEEDGNPVNVPGQFGVARFGESQFGFPVTATTLAVPVATATGVATAPTFRQRFTGNIATASSTAPVPALALGRIIDAPTATANGTATAPTQGVRFTSPIGIANAAAPVPVMEQARRFDVPVSISTGVGVAPSMEVATRPTTAIASGVAFPSGAAIGLPGATATVVATAPMVAATVVADPATATTTGTPPTLAIRNSPANSVATQFAPDFRTTFRVPVDAATGAAAGPQVFGPVTVVDVPTATADGVAYRAAIPAPPEYARPTADITVSDWTVAPLWSKIEETPFSDADVILSSNATNTACEVALSDVADPMVSSGHIVRYRYAKSAATGNARDLTVALVQGTTVIASATHVGISEVFTAGSFTLTGPQADAITDYADLRVRFTSGGSVGGSAGAKRNVRVSWVEVQVPGVVSYTDLLVDNAGTADGVAFDVDWAVAFTPDVAVAAAVADVPDVTIPTATIITVDVTADAAGIGRAATVAASVPVVVSPGTGAAVSPAPTTRATPALLATALGTAIASTTRVTSVASTSAATASVLPPNIPALGAISIAVPTASGAAGAASPRVGGSPFFPPATGGVAPFAPRLAFPVPGASATVQPLAVSGRVGAYAPLPGITGGTLAPVPAVRWASPVAASTAAGFPPSIPALTAVAIAPPIATASATATPPAIPALTAVRIDVPTATASAILAVPRWVFAVGPVAGAAAPLAPVVASRQSVIPATATIVILTLSPTAAIAAPRPDMAGVAFPFRQGALFDVLGAVAWGAARIPGAQQTSDLLAAVGIGRGPTTDGVAGGNGHIPTSRPRGRVVSRGGATVTMGRSRSTVGVSGED